jgi:glycosyltransferase involved in cell wall biosynthesis
MFFADHVVLLSDEYATILSKILSIFYRKHKVSIISNGINVKKFFLKSKSTALTRDNEIKIGMMSRLSFTKDQPTLIKAFKILLDRKMGLFKLFIAGEGDKEKGLKDFTQKLGLTKEITFLGLLNEMECVSFLQSLDIYIHSSISETMSTAIMQAMACGLPIIASNVDGITNMIIDRKTGLIFELGNEDDLVQKIDILINNIELRETLSQNAYKCAHDKYSNIAMYEKYCELIV